MTPTTMRGEDRRLWSYRLASILLYGTPGLLMFGPLAFGSVEPWSIFVLETGATFLVLVWLAKQWVDGEMRIRWNPLFLPMGIFALLIVAQLLLGKTAYRHDTISGALLYCAYAMLCFLSCQTLFRNVQARRLAWVFSIYGAALASFALLQGIAPNGKLYWMRTPRMGGQIYGPYVNHNHYAGLMEMLIPIPLVLSVSRLANPRQRMMAAAAAAVMAATIFLSGSRGGMAAFLVEMLILAVVLVRQQRGVKTALSVGAFLLVVISLLTWIGGGELGRRLSSISTETRSELTGGTRLTIDRDALHMFSRKPVLGWGLGSFPVAYPQFRSFYTNFFVNEAHNDYLQLLVEMGLLGFGTMLWFLIVLYRRAISKIKNWTSDVSGAVTLACILGCSGILVHSTLDFNLQIPANAALFYVFCTVAAADALAQPVRKRRPIPTPAEDVLRASEVV
jgi:O-antigen ligase